MKRLLYIAIACSLASCARFHERRVLLTGGDEVVAEVGQYKMYKSELKAVTDLATDHDDSVKMADAYIRQWATDILFYEKAHARIDKDIEQMAEEYKRSLYLHRYEEELVERRMRKKVTESEIQAYYDANKDLYILHEDILKGVLIIVPNTAPETDKLRQWMQHPEDHPEQIEKYAYKYASGYQLFTDEWVSGNQVMIRMPFEGANLSQKMQNSNNIELQDSTATYLLHISDKHQVGETMPLDYAEPQIRAAILQKRQVDMIRTYREALYEKARKGKLKIYKADEK